MVDQKPPRMAASERETLHVLLQYQRESLLRKVSGVADPDSRRRFVASGTTLLWLTCHMAQAEIIWVPRRFAGQVDPVPDDNVACDGLAAAVDFYRATWARVDAVVAASGLEELCRRADDEAPVNLRWVLLHLLEEDDLTTNPSAITSLAAQQAGTRRNRRSASRAPRRCHPTAHRADVSIAVTAYWVTAADEPSDVVSGDD